MDYIDFSVSGFILIIIGLFALLIVGAVNDVKEYNNYVNKCIGSGNQVVLTGYDRQSHVCVNKDYQIMEVK